VNGLASPEPPPPAPLEPTASYATRVSDTARPVAKSDLSGTSEGVNMVFGIGTGNGFNFFPGASPFGGANLNPIGGGFGQGGGMNDAEALLRLLLPLVSPPQGGAGLMGFAALGGAQAGAAAPAPGQTNATQIEQLLRQLRDVAQKDPTALMQALQKFPELAQLLSALLGIQAPAGAGPAAGGGHAGGGAGGEAPARLGPGEKPSKGRHGGIHMDGPDGFLWKPTSESDRNLAVLAPANLQGRVNEVVIKDASGNVIDRAGLKAYFGDTGRGIFRFKKPGASYPPNVTVEMRLNDGSTKSYQVRDPSQRYD
jgi:hypothetical protein